MYKNKYYYLEGLGFISQRETKSTHHCSNSKHPVEPKNIIVSGGSMGHNEPAPTSAP
jgi:hypothetical protein